VTDKARIFRLINWVTLAISTAIGLGLFFIFKNSLPPLVPIFYGLPWGEAQLGKPIYLLLPTGFSFAFSVLANLFSTKVKEFPLVCMVVGASMTIQLIVTLSILRIVLLVG